MGKHCNETGAVRGAESHRLCVVLMQLHYSILNTVDYLLVINIHRCLEPGLCYILYSVALLLFSDFELPSVSSYLQTSGQACCCVSDWRPL